MNIHHDEHRDTSQCPWQKQVDWNMPGENVWTGRQGQPVPQHHQPTMCATHMDVPSKRGSALSAINAHIADNQQPEVMVIFAKRWTNNNLFISICWQQTFFKDIQQAISGYLLSCPETSQYTRTITRNIGMLCHRTVTGWSRASNQARRHKTLCCSITTTAQVN